MSREVPLAATAECATPQAGTGCKPRGSDPGFPGHQFLRLAHDAHENAKALSHAESASRVMWTFVRQCLAADPNPEVRLNRGGSALREVRLTRSAKPLRHN